MSPQLENGYVKIANELLEALIRYRIPGEQRQCFDFIIRKTYGFNKKEDQISNSQFVEATGLRPANVSRATKALSDKKLVIKTDNGRATSYRINKYYVEWKVLSKVITKPKLSKVITPVIKNDNNEKGVIGESESFITPSCDVEKGSFDQAIKDLLETSCLLSKPMDTKDINNVTKERDSAGSCFEKQKPNKAYIEKLSFIASGRTDHHLVNDYAWSGESFEDMKIRASRELEVLKRK